MGTTRARISIKKEKTTNSQGEEDAGGVAGVQVEEVGVVVGEDVEDAGAGHLATVTPGRKRNCPL